MALSPLARAAGVKPGMRRAGALMLAPQARLHERSPELEAQALQAVALALLQYSPLVAQGEEATLLVDAGASLELFDRVEHADALLFGARRLLQQMTGWLCARQFAVERIQLLLVHERGRVARPPTVIDLALGEAVWRDEHLVRLLKERLAQLSLDAPVIGLTLEALQVQPMAPPSESLFPEPGGTPQERQRLLELLVARLGAENVLQASPRADYRPEAANQWLPLPSKPGGKNVPPDLPPGLSGMPRPGWLLAQPIALLMREHRPFYGSPLKMVSVAERIEAGWWGQSQARDYFIAEGLDHAHYWVYRERIAGSGEDAAPRWFLHGLFG